jgi:hypothetical protein
MNGATAPPFTDSTTSSRMTKRKRSTGTSQNFF